MASLGLFSTVLIKFGSIGGRLGVIWYKRVWIYEEHPLYVATSTIRIHPLRRGWRQAAGKPTRCLLRTGFEHPVFTLFKCEGYREKRM
jgi:hypothetical protein